MSVFPSSIACFVFAYTFPYKARRWQLRCYLHVVFPYVNFKGGFPRRLPFRIGCAASRRKTLDAQPCAAVFSFSCILLPLRRMPRWFVGIIIDERKPRAPTVVPRFIFRCHCARCPVATVQNVGNALTVGAYPLEVAAIHVNFIARQMEYGVTFIQRKVVNAAIHFDSSSLLF